MKRLVEKVAFQISGRFKIYIPILMMKKNKTMFESKVLLNNFLILFYYFMKDFY